MTSSATAAAGGLYSFKSWYAGRLAPVRRRLVTAGVPPWAITLAGIGFGGGAGLALALLRPGLVAGVVVAVLLAARLGCANLDGGVAREGNRATPFGSVLNELGDRGAELAALAGCLAFAPPALVLAAALAATLPSWVALAGAAAGLGRVQGGPVGKTERCLLLALLALLGFPVVLLAVLAAGSLLTAAVRVGRLARLGRS
jgi:CDP-diacylglycerol--glycerol-3-phosphate 3-phosphatidyltransferase